ncbi:MAG: nucleotidyltransferase [Actinobacteria bacterium HGW-Actinobacteria-9]|nr:MAG: nucleotidyltransferase [Actinobacteria bacterium HGW-Actinobacteria-9]
MRDWEKQFGQWASPPSATEEQRCVNTEKAIREAIQASDVLKSRNIKVFTTGSYKNNTNVRLDSDIDIGVVCYDVFFPDYPEGTTQETFGNVDGGYTYAAFKNEVGQALVARFGTDHVSRGNKAFDVHENTYRVDADVAAFFEHRRYQRSGDFIAGVELRPDNGTPGKVINWPEQHYSNGVAKNNATGRRFKGVVRILKCVCNEMTEAKIAAATNIPGFLIECLVWNVPNAHFGHSTLTGDVRAALAFLFNNTRTDAECSEWGEVSELKYLFRGTQKWTRGGAHAFISAAWDYVGFEG